MKIYILKMCAIVILFIINVCNETTFAAYKDIDNHWAVETIKEFETKGFLEGKNEEFGPEEYITKGELAVIVNKFFSYGDVLSKEENLNLAEEKGYLANSKINELITREEVAIIICKVLSLAPSEEVDTRFIDDLQISVWSKGYVCTLALEEIIIGYPDNTYKPQKNITKAEFVTLLNRCVGIGGKDLEIIEEEIEGIEVGIINYDDGKINIRNIEDSIEVSSGDIINLAVMLSDKIKEEQIIIDIKEKDVILINEELYTLTALKEGQTGVVFRTNDKMYEKMFMIKVK